MWSVTAESAGFHRLRSSYLLSLEATYLATQLVVVAGILDVTTGYLVTNPEKKKTVGVSQGRCSGRRDSSTLFSFHSGTKTRFLEEEMTSAIPSRAKNGRAVGCFCLWWLSFNLEGELSPACRFKGCEAWLDRGHPERLPVLSCLSRLANEYNLLNKIDH